MVYGTMNVMQTQREFYQDLYTTKGTNSVKRKQFTDCINRKVTDEQNELLNKALDLK